MTEWELTKIFVLGCIGFFCAGYVVGYKIAFNRKLTSLEKVCDDLIEENKRLRA